MSIPPNSTGRGLRTLSFEVMPPRRPHLAPKFWGTVDTLLQTEPDFISITYGAAGQDRSSARAVVRKIVRDTPVQPIAHLTCVGASRDEVTSVVTDYLDSGVRTFLALRGDPPVNYPEWRPQPGGLASATELITLIRALERRRTMTEPGAALRAAFKPLTIAVATFPSGNPEAGTTPEQEIERLLVKQAAGANFAITQLFFDPEAYALFSEKARSYGVTIPIMPGLLLPTDPTRLARVAELTKVEAPSFLLDDLAAARDEQDLYERGIKHGVALARGVLDAGAPGVHLYTFNKAQPALDLLEQVPELTPLP
ncbi:MAG: methylenetetrahydrofolate reductase [Ancrocorticia sp.]